MVDKALADMNFLDRVQSAFAPEEMNEGRLNDWLTMAKPTRREVKWGLDKKGEQRTKIISATKIPLDLSLKISELSERLSETSEIYEAAQTEVEIAELVRLRPKAKELKVHRDRVEEEIEDSIRLAQEVKEAERERVEEETKKFMISEFKEAETAEEVIEVRRELKRTLPFSLRSLKGWETRRGRIAFVAVFGRD